MGFEYGLFEFTHCQLLAVILQLLLWPLKGTDSFPEVSTLMGQLRPLPQSITEGLGSQHTNFSGGLGIQSIVCASQSSWPDTWTFYLCKYGHLLFIFANSIPCRQFCPLRNYFYPASFGFSSSYPTHHSCLANFLPWTIC